MLSILHADRITPFLEFNVVNGFWIKLSTAAYDNRKDGINIAAGQINVITQVVKQKTFMRGNLL